MSIVCVCVCVPSPLRDPLGISHVLMFIVIPSTSARIAGPRPTLPRHHGSTPLPLSVSGLAEAFPATVLAPAPAVLVPVLVRIFALVVLAPVPAPSPCPPLRLRLRFRLCLGLRPFANTCITDERLGPRAPLVPSSRATPDAAGAPLGRPPVRRSRAARSPPHAEMGKAGTTTTTQRWETCGKHKKAARASMPSAHTRARKQRQRPRS